MLLCKKCGSKTILATAFITCFDPHEEPYENGVKEECGYEDGIAAEVSVGIHWCPKCGGIVDVWIEEPMEKDVRDEQLRTENKRLENAYNEMCGGYEAKISELKQLCKTHAEYDRQRLDLLQIAKRLKEILECTSRALNMPRGNRASPERQTVKENKMRIQEVIDCLTNGVGEKPYCRRVDEVMKVFVADDQEFCTVALDNEGEYDEQIANAICEAGLIIKRLKDVIEEVIELMDEEPAKELLVKALKGTQ